MVFKDHTLTENYCARVLTSESHVKNNKINSKFKLDVTYTIHNLP